VQQRMLGRTGLDVSAIGMGGIPIRRPPFDEAVALYRQAMDRGITFFDAARGYLRCEDRLGEAIRGRREEVVIASKCGDRTAEGVAQAIEESLRTLGTEYLDVYECHGVCQFEDLEACLAPGGALEGLQAAQAQGKIRFTGLTGHNADVLLKAVQTGAFDVILVIFNYMNDEPARELLPYCAEHGIGVTVMKPLGGSTLAGHADLALRWVLQHPVHSAAVGMWRAWEVETNARLGEDPQPLTAEETSILSEQRAWRSPMHCRLCYRHHKCPQGVDITDLMIADLCYTRHGIAELMGRGWGERIEAAGQCLTCAMADECRASCPYSVDIPGYLARAHAAYMPLVQAYRSGVAGGQ